MSGARLAVDVGSVRIGLAQAPAGIALALPVATIAAGPDAVNQVAGTIVSLGVQRVYVGDPVTLAGDVGPAAQHARAFAAELAEATDAEVRLVDERLTTAQSTKQLRAAGRAARQARSVIDQAAAVAILQAALEREAATGDPAGQSVERMNR